MSKKKLYGWGHMHQPALYTSQDMADGINKRLDELDAIYGSAISKITAIRSDGQFTAKGKTNALTELSAEVERDIKNWRIVEDHLADQIRQLEESMIPKRNRPDDIVGELRQREVREFLRTLDPVDLEAQYLAAAQSSDELLLSAIEESPIPFSFATKGLVDKVRFSRLEKAYPEQAAKLADLQVAQSSVSSALKSVLHDLAKQRVVLASEDKVGLQAA